MLNPVPGSDGAEASATDWETEDWGTEDWDEADWDDGERGDLLGEVADVLEARLIEGGVAEIDDLARYLVASEPELVVALDGDGDGGEATVESATAIVEDVVRSFDGFWTLPDGRLGATELADRPARLSHLVSADELARGVLEIDPDLSVLSGPRDYSLRAGGICRDRTEDLPTGGVQGVLAGPPGWLDAFAPGDLVVVDWDGETIGLETADRSAIDPADDERAIGLLRSALGAHDRSEDAIEPFELLLDVRVGHPDTFARTLSPIRELFERAGIELRDDWLGWAGEDWETPPQAAIRQRYEQTVRSVEVERCCAAQLRVAYASWRDWAGGPLGAAEADRVADAFDHGPVPDLLWEIVSWRRAGDLTPWIEAVAAPATDVSAGLRYLRGRAAELHAEPLAAVEHLERALVLDPSHPGALLALAELRADAGDGPGAARLLGRLGVGRDEQLFAAFAPGVRALGGVGRNERCPCGSGRKFKACCARSPRPPELAVRLRWLLTRAARYVSQRHRDRAEMTLARLRSLYGADADTASLGASAIEQLLFEDRGLAAYLDARAALLPEDERAATATWPAEVPRLVEVASTSPGDSFEALDLRTGERFVVADVAASESLQVGEAVLSRVLPAGERSLLPGGVHRVSLQARSWVLEVLDGPLTRWTMFELIERLVARPELRNREGQALALQRATFAIADPAAVRATLVAFEDIDEIVDDADAGDGAGAGDGGGPLVLGFQLNDDERIVRGRFEFAPGRVVIDTNSVERLEQMRSLLVAAAPDAELVDLEETGAEQLWRGVDERRAGAGEDTHEGASEPDPELEALVADHIRTLERRWVNEQIPALGGLTPRQALDDPTRRGDLLRLLDEMEGRSGVNGFDAGRLRALLGL